ncbi:NAD(P)/FAD-dependent oxidoreductase [Streptomyces sp. NPDC090093]|uniref:NAD(P)/FAD-dependent oxidoreductase n=1 Tax=Streptomyces sp. NPDC090093 TaxID=3365945 RepID=UPI0037F74520
MQRAVVLGGSFAGLVAARVLSDFFDDVVIVEPASLGREKPAGGAPHRQQLHALLAMGRLQLERFFPGITSEMTAAGAQLGRDGEIRFYIDGVRKVPVPGTTALSATRPFIEDHVRRRVRALGNIRIQQARAKGLSFAGSRVSGVRLTVDEGEPEAFETLQADLVIDAMGRSSRLSRWLDGAGWQPAPLDRMRIDLGYATARFTRAGLLPDTYRELDDLVVAHSIPGPASGYQPTHTETGAVAAIEGEAWSVVLAGYADHKPSAAPEEFLARMHRCIEPLREVAETCKMIGEPEAYTFSESRRRRFTDLSRFPAGLIVVGDAMASVNPVYGQGLTLATLQASSLAAHLRSGASVREPAWDYFRRADVVVNAAWDLSTTADLVQPHVKGPYPPGYKVTSWIADRITEASVKDLQINSTFLNVLQMLEHPKALTRPQVLLRTAKVLLQR